MQVFIRGKKAWNENKKCNHRHRKYITVFLKCMKSVLKRIVNLRAQTRRGRGRVGCET